MESKYYTPTIEEFHFGFEYQVLVTNVWCKFFCGLEGPINASIPYNNVKETFRVKCLNTEDIESLLFPLGFRKEDITYASGTEIYIKGDIYNKAIQISLLNDGTVKITKYDFKGENNRDSYYTIFIGIIKNKSELKTIMKQVGIL